MVGNLHHSGDYQVRSVRRVQSHPVKGFLEVSSFLEEKETQFKKVHTLACTSNACNSPLDQAVTDFKELIEVAISKGDNVSVGLSNIPPRFDLIEEHQDNLSKLNAAMEKKYVMSMKSHLRTII